MQVLFSQEGDCPGAWVDTGLVDVLRRIRSSDAKRPTPQLPGLGRVFVLWCGCMGPCGTAHTRHRAWWGPARSASLGPQTSAVDPVRSGVSSDAGCLSGGSVAGFRGRQEMAFPAPLCAALLAGVCLVLNGGSVQLPWKLPKSSLGKASLSLGRGGGGRGGGGSTGRAAQLGRAGPSPLRGVDLRPRSCRVPPEAAALGAGEQRGKEALTVPRALGPWPLLLRCGVVAVSELRHTCGIFC